MYASILYLFILHRRLNTLLYFPGTLFSEYAERAENTQKEIFTSTMSDEVKSWTPFPENQA
jgi:hypothetical protein